VSQKNVDRAWRASRDFESLLDALADDIVWDNRDYGAELPPEWVASVAGKAAVTAMLRSWVGTWDDFRFDVEEIIDGGDSVVVVVRETGRGRGSGLPMAHDYCHVWSFEAGSIVAATAYSSKVDALRAVGLSAALEAVGVARGTSQDVDSSQGMAEGSRAGDLAAGADALHRRDLDALMRFYAHDAVRAGGAGSDKGHAAIRRFYEDWLSAFDDFEIEAEELCDFGNGVTLTVLFTRGRLLGSTGWIQARVATVAVWAGSLIESSWDYSDVERARAAAQRLARERGAD
jgi:ketosteroid isomerase-like protein